jgi:hypothetical protein
MAEYLVARVKSSEVSKDLARRSEVRDGAEVGATSCVGPVEVEGLSRSVLGGVQSRRSLKGDQRCRSVAARADFEVLVVWSCDVDDVGWCGDVRKTGCNRRCRSMK